MEDTREANLKNVIAQLKVSVHEVDLLRNDIVEHVDELDGIKENLQSSILLLKESLKI